MRIQNWKNKHTLDFDHSLSMVRLSLMLMLPFVLVPNSVEGAGSRVSNIVCPDNSESVIELALKEYNYRHGGRFRMKRVSSEVYDYQLQKYLSFGRIPALFCTDPSGASRYYNDGWIESLNGIQSFQRIKTQMLPNMGPSVTSNDLLLGVPYAGTVSGLPIVLKKIYNSEDYIKPLDWHQLYESAYLYSQKLNKPTLLPAWDQDNIALSFVTEVMNRSRYRAEDGMDLAGSVAEKVLTDWKNALVRKTVPEDSLVIDLNTAATRLQTGLYVYGITSLKAYLDVAVDLGPRNNEYSLLSGWGQNWGILDVRMLAMTKQNDRSESDAEDIRRFLHWFIFDDKSTKINDMERVLEKSKLFSVYRPENELNVSTASLSVELEGDENLERALFIYKRAKYPASVLAVPTADDLKEGLRNILTDFMRDQIPLDISINKIRKLMKFHGIVKHT